MKVIRKTELTTRSLFRSLGLALVLLLTLSLLAACGATPPPQAVDNNYTVPAYQATGVQFTEVTALENDPAFQSKVLVKDANTGPESVKVFSTTATLAAVKTYYTDQMTKLGWTDRSSAIVDPTVLGTDAWVLGFEKGNGQNPPVNHIVGLYMFTSGSKALSQFSGSLPQGQNILVQISGASALDTTPTTK